MNIVESLEKELSLRNNMVDKLHNEITDAADREEALKKEVVRLSGKGPFANPNYASLRRVLDRAYEQASAGKGRECHATGEPFEDQLIVRLGGYMGGSTVFNIGQACKKSIESLRLDSGRTQAELLGAINYLAGAVVILEKRAADDAG